jgi:hypothetical protein
MADSPLKQLLKDKPTSSAPSESQPDSPPVSPSVVSRAHPYILDFVQLNGNHVGLPYTSLLFLSWNTSDDIVIMFATHTVKIKGVLLEPIYEAIVAESVGKLIAIGDRPRDNPKDVPVVQFIEITKRTGPNASDGDVT